MYFSIKSAGRSAAKVPSLAEGSNFIFFIPRDQMRRGLDPSNPFFQIFFYRSAAKTAAKPFGEDGSIKNVGSQIPKTYFLKKILSL
jgi:hypothetical protein